MAVVTYDGGEVVKDPDANRLYTVDWTNDIGSASISTSTWTVTGPDTSLAYDNASIVSGSKMAAARLTGGTAGKTYTVTNRIVTNSTPAETEDASFTVVIANQ